CKNFEKPFFRQYIENILLHRGWLSEDQKMTDFIMLTDKTELLLKSLGFIWPKLSANQLYNMVIKSLEDRISFIQTVSLFEGLDNEDLEYVARVSKEVIYEEDSNIMLEDQSNKNLYIIVDGIIELSRHSKSGWLGTISLVSEGDFIGEDIFLKDEVSPVNANVIFEDAVVLEIKDIEVTRLIKKSPEFSLAFLGAMSERLRRLERMIVNIG
ncbi:MAG: Crp/Fnr family transcriptional regulator, partial [Cyanobacteriota bacterium]